MSHPTQPPASPPPDDGLWDRRPPDDGPFAYAPPNNRFPGDLRPDNLPRGSHHPHSGLPLAELLLVPGVQWSAMLRDGAGTVLDAVDPAAVLRTASVGKVLLLLAASRLVETGHLDLGEMLTRTPQDWVADSGAWHTLLIDALPAGDVASLIGLVSDNLATNVLLRRVGLDAVDEVGRELGLREARLLDFVRVERTPDLPWTLSTGSAAELSELALRIAQGSALGPSADARVVEWLRGGTDLPVAGGLGFDVLAHRRADLPDGVDFWNKTGADAGCRADVGVLTVQGVTISYAVVAAWDPQVGNLTAEVDAAMRRVGEQWLPRPP